jgi:hypothetical protein
MPLAAEAQTQELAPKEGAAQACLVLYRYNLAKGIIYQSLPS